MSNTFLFQAALVGQQWQDNVRVSVSDEGLIERIECNVPAGDV